jgi:hypothetical protein
MATKKKLEISLIDLLHNAGFETTVEINDRIINASGAEDFRKSHTAFLQSACNHPALAGCLRFETVPKPVLIVHQRPAAAEVGDQMSEISGDGSGHTFPPVSNEEKTDTVGKPEEPATRH